MICALWSRLTITEIIGIASAITANNITSPKNAAVIYPAPSAKDPVSPMNILAGYLLYTRNPKQAPAITINGNDPLEFPYEIINIADAIEAIAIIPAARPSIPSIRLTEFIDPTIPNITTGIINIPILNPSKVAPTAPEAIRNKETSIWAKIFSFSFISLFIGASPVISTKLFFKRYSKSFFALGVVTQAFSPVLRVNLPISTSFGLIFLITF